MLNSLDSAEEIKKYLRKLLRLIEREAVFSLFKTKFIDKNRADDIICCVEASIPKYYKDYVRKTGGKKLKSHGLWLQTLGMVKNKFSLAPSLYSIKVGPTMQVINDMINTIDSDIAFLNSEAAGMF